MILSYSLASLAQHFALFAVKKKSLRFLFKLSILTVFNCYFINSTIAQDERLSESVRSILEELAGDESGEEAGNSITERLYDLSEKPVDLNSSDEQELSRLFFLTDFQVKSLADYVRKSGKILTVFEIMNIPGFNRDLAEMLAPFITLGSQKDRTVDSSRISSNLVMTFSQKFGTGDTTAPGPPWKLLSRYRLAAGRINAGFTTEKDAGELLLTGKPPGPDFYSANISWSGKGVLRKVIAGDISGSFGLGTCVNTGPATGLSLTAAGYLSGGDEIRLCTSTDENNFFRGAGFSLKFRKVSVTCILSDNRIDATVDTLPGTGTRTISTFYRAGLHNSSATLKKKDAVREYAAAISASCDFNNIRFGVVWSGVRFSIPVRKAAGDPESVFDFEGDRNSVMSVWYKAVTGKLILFGEAAADVGLKTAVVQGASFRLSDRLTGNLLCRSYAPGFTSFHGKGLFQSSSGDNVRGIFGNFTFEAARYLFISCGCDLRWYPWLRYRCSTPSEAKSCQAMVKYQPAGPCSAEIAYDYRCSVYDDPEKEGIKKQYEAVSHSFKGAFRITAGDNLAFTTRLEYRRAVVPESRGTALIQDISVKFSDLPLRCWFRCALFTTDDWNSRIYAYENDLPGTFNIPALSGKGSRIAVMLQWEPIRATELRIKYSTGDLAGREAPGPSDLRIQLKLRF